MEKLLYAATGGIFCICRCLQVNIALDKMLHENYLCLVESSKQQIQEVESKTQPENLETKATAQRVWIRPTYSVVCPPRVSPNPKPGFWSNIRYPKPGYFWMQNPGFITYQSSTKRCSCLRLRKRDQRI